MSATAHPGMIEPQRQALADARVRVGATGVPWYIWAGVAAVTSSTIGGAWDVSWHRTIGRDSFWTPAHMMIYLCGVLAGVVGMYLVAKCTFGHDPAMRAASVKVLGLHAPLGVFLAGWGGLAMLTSAPFDNWWHNAYGLDVQIVSPPHTVLILGIRAVAVGMLFLILAQMNRVAALAGVSTAIVSAGDSGQASFAPANPALFRHLQILFLYLGGLSVGGQMFFLQEYTWDVKLHNVGAYIAMAIAVPVMFAVFSEASRFRWAATSVALIYTLVVLAQILILPLVPAEPKLGPVFNPVTHLIPAKFPILIVVPALALDLLWQRTRGWRQWQVALLSGFVFVAVLAAVEWPFATFLMAKASENRFFGTIYFDYDSRPTGFDRMRQWLNPDHGLAISLGLLRASIYGAISTWIGMAFGRWMRGVQR